MKLLTRIIEYEIISSAFSPFSQLITGCSEKDPESALKGCCTNPPIDENVGTGHVYVANIFTPNWDGVNDYMAISTNAIDLIVEVEVRNKQGEKVFESTTVEINNSITSWDGKVDGVVKEGVYTITVSVLAADGTSRTLTGSVCNYPCDGRAIWKVFRPTIVHFLPKWTMLILRPIYHPANPRNVLSDK